MTDKVLIVDDEEMNRELAATILRKEPYELVFAASGREAVRKLGEHDNIGVVVLDLMMSDGDGFWVLENLPPMAPPPRILIVSALGERSVIQKGLRMGAGGYLTKPYDLIELKGKIREGLAQFREACRREGACDLSPRAVLAAAMDDEHMCDALIRCLEESHPELWERMARLASRDHTSGDIKEESRYNGADE